MHIVLVGLNHKSAPIEVRERLAFRQERLGSAFARLRQEIGIREAAILSTCNRVEIYAGVTEVDGTIPRLQEFLSRHGGVELPGLEPQLYSYCDSESVSHLFGVASGIDSMVLGEDEILHQVKQAYELACEHDAAGKLIHALFQRALNTAKTVRSQTGIGRGATSVGSVAVELSQKIFGRLSSSKVLLIGAGKIGEQTLKSLSLRGTRDVRILNRSMERAAALAATCQGTAGTLERLPQDLVETDIVIASTSAPAYLISQADVAQALHARRQRPLCIVDLGVPRNIDPAVAQLDNVYLFDIDDLQGLVNHHHQEREQATLQARTIIEQKAGHFVSWLKTEGQLIQAGSRV